MSGAQAPAGLTVNTPAPTNQLPLISSGTEGITDTDLGDSGQKAHIGSLLWG